MNSNDAAESIIRMSLNGIEVAAKISGVGAKNLVALICAKLKEPKTTRGKTNLVKMLKTGKELSIFSVRKADLKKFTQEAKRYGIAFTALVDKNKKKGDGITDIIVKAEDAARVNRIVERFKLTVYNQASIESKIAEDSKENSNKGIEVIGIDDNLVDDILGKSIQKEENTLSNPNLAKMEKSPPSEPLSDYKSDLKGKTLSTIKPSIREEIKKIKEKQRQNNNVDSKDVDKGDVKKNDNSYTQNKTKKNKKEKQR